MYYYYTIFGLFNCTNKNYIYLFIIFDCSKGGGGISSSVILILSEGGVYADV